MTFAYEGQARRGDFVRTYWGVLEIVDVKSAGDVIEAIVEQRISMRAPNFLRDSIAGRCAMFGSTTGRERRNYERFKQKQREKQTCRSGYSTTPSSSPSAA